MNCKSLGPQRIHKATLATLRRQPQTSKQKPTASKSLKSPSRTGKGSPEKIRRDNTPIEFECDTSISISSDESIGQNNTQSPQTPPAKKVDRKNTPPQEILPSRRSTRIKTSALANKFGNAISISTVDNANTADTAVCNITIQPLETKEVEPTSQAAGITHESSTDINCIEISTHQGKTEQLKIEETIVGPKIENCASISDTTDREDKLFTPTKTTHDQIHHKTIREIICKRQHIQPRDPNRQKHRREEQLAHVT